MSEKSAHILYVEDDLNLGFVTKDNLTLAGYEVMHCTDGQEALNAIEKENFDLCILDIMLPLADGFEIAEKIRKKDKDIPILFLSAKSLSEDKIKGLKIGADDYITKPFSIEELLLKIKIFLKRSLVSTPEEEKIQFEKVGKYQFDTINLTLNSGDHLRQLTKKEASLLHLLIKHKNEVIKREEILMSIWGDDDYFLGRSLDVFISKLRSYLNSDPKIKIENIHGIGFRMNC